MWNFIFGGVTVIVLEVLVMWWMLRVAGESHNKQKEIMDKENKTNSIN